MLRRLLLALALLVPAAADAQFATQNPSAAAITAGTLDLARGGTGQSAATAQALAYALKLPYVIASSGAAVTNTAIGTSEVSMVAVPVPALAANDAIRITTLWDTTGSVATNTKHLIVRLSATACPTPLVACSTGSVILDLTMNSAALISEQPIMTIRNANATNAQIMFPTANGSGIGQSSQATATAAIQTNAGGFLNINSTTTTASTDTVKLLGYTVELIPGS
jgi:hypothetical protein